MVARERIDVVGFAGSTEKTGRFAEWRQSGFSNAVFAGGAVPLPLDQGKAVAEAWIVVAERLAVSPDIAWGCVVSDQAGDGFAVRPGVLGGFPLLERAGLRGYFPFKRAAVLAEGYGRERF